jgi:molecular chaperone GrpE
MQQFNYGQFGRPRYRRRPENREIRIPLRGNGNGSRGADVTSPKKATGPEPRRNAVGKSAEELTRTRSDQGQNEKRQAEAAEWKEKYLRLRAERENDRKRLERVYANAADEKKEQVLRDLLPLADNLERALVHASEQDPGLREGVELTLKALTTTLAKHGASPIKAVGMPFDPLLHEAAGVVPHPTLPSGSVASVEETGYTLHSRVLRPARVLVVGERQ